MRSFFQSRVSGSPMSCLVFAAAALVLVAACNDAPGPPSGPGDNVVDDTNQDAVAEHTQDTGVVPPQGTVDGAYPDSSYLSAGGSTGYIDASSPRTACASCSCGMNRGFCLEDGVTATVTGTEPGDAGLCTLASATSLAVGCNPLPDSCPKPTCQCLLNAIPLGCYPECTSNGGYFDVFCPNP
jgi:hypothetical protein